MCVRHYAFVTVILNIHRLQAIQMLKRRPYILDFMKQLLVMCMSVTIDGFWIDDRIYWTSDTACDYTLEFTITHTLVPTATSSLSVAQ
jgi:hypothetical protein